MQRHFLPLFMFVLLFRSGGALRCRSTLTLRRFSGIAATNEEDAGVTILPFLPTLRDPSKCQVILASASPRRKELLERNLGLQPTILASKFAEDLDKASFRSSADYTLATSRGKALDLIQNNVALLQMRDTQRLRILIAADTIVVHSCHDTILEKPCDAADAFSMLSMLAGKQHTVQTSVCVFVSPPGSGDFQLRTEFVEASQVKFQPLTSADINAYIATGEPFDKAGSYGIQLYGSLLVRSITGCYFNVMGLPVSRLSLELAGVARDFLS